MLESTLTIPCDHMSDDFTKRLREETQRWQADNLLSAEQCEAILRRYETVPDIKTTKTLTEPQSSDCGSVRVQQ